MSVYQAHGQRVVITQNPVIGDCMATLESYNGPDADADSLIGWGKSPEAAADDLFGMINLPEVTMLEEVKNG